MAGRLGRVARGRTWREWSFLLLVTAILGGAIAYMGHALYQEVGGQASGHGIGEDGKPFRMPTRAEVDQLLRTDTVAITEAEAERLNAARPIEVKAPRPAQAFFLSRQEGGVAHLQDALTCMTQAVYYEAAMESDMGQRAVAQVVLNRVRHSAFPNSVCGVVYQGWQRKTGCQFSFTCDGSLSRTPSANGWRRAQRVASASLSGWVEKSVGLATHYHASYVLPYWASSLDKVNVIGLHHFYTMRGPIGTAGAFRSRYNSAGDVVPAASPSEDPMVNLTDLTLPVDILDEAANESVTKAPERTLLHEDRLGRPLAGQEPQPQDAPPADGEAIPPAPLKIRPRADERNGGPTADDRSGKLIVN